MKTRQILGYAGVIPFLLGIYFSTGNFNVGIHKSLPFIAYSAVILSFLAGSLWKVHMIHPCESNEKQRMYLEHDSFSQQQIVSNIISVLAFLCILISPEISLILLALGYLFIWFYERRINGINSFDELPENYLSMRTHLTLIVFSLHSLAYMLWFL